jgi:hypothetical protein
MADPDVVFDKPVTCRLPSHAKTRGKEKRQCKTDYLPGPGTQPDPQMHLYVCITSHPWTEHWPVPNYSPLTLSVNIHLVSLSCNLQWRSGEKQKVG